MIWEPHHANPLPLTGILADIVANKPKEIANWKQRFPNVLPVNPPDLHAPSVFEAMLSAPGGVSRLIAEFKPASPSAGVLADAASLPEFLETYNPVAQGLSVLADEQYFQGAPETVRQAAGGSPHPVLWKDFVLDSFQIALARYCGASAVLLIAKCLPDASLRCFVQQCHQLGLTPVVEVQTEAETERARTAEATVVLINNRNLETFAIDLATTERLSTGMPSEVRVISASGIQTPADIQRLAPFADAFLVGTSLMQIPSVAGRLEKLAALAQACPPRERKGAA